MKPGIDIRHIVFGVPAAERDDDLIACFVNNESYERIRAKGKNVVLGNRGTGKSALFKKLADDEIKAGRIVISLAPEDYSYEMMNSVIEKESKGAWAKTGAYSVAWKFMIYISAFQEITRVGPYLKTGKRARIYNYIRDNYKEYDKNPIGLLISYLKRIEGIKIGSWEASLKTRKLDSLYKLDEISELIDAIEDIGQKNKILILVDELDKGWDASEDAVGFVSGLFHAAMSINSRHKNLRVIISLRRELYDNIPAIYDDAQKFRDVIETIHWNEDLLLELVGRRIANKLPNIKFRKYRDAWNAIFAETLDYRKANSFNYVIDRTLFRPREIIQFCNDIADKARESGHTLPLNYPSIVAAESSYSEARMHDIAAEYRHQYLGLNSIFETFRGKKYRMTRELLEEHLVQVACGSYKLSAESSWFMALEIEKMIKVLWEVGFVMIQAVGGIKGQRRSGSDWLGSYQITGVNIYDKPAYQVHPMFRSFLGMKEK